MKNSLIQLQTNQTLLQNILQRTPTAWLVLVIALFATAWSGLVVKTMERQQTKSNIFDFRVERIKSAIIDRMHIYQQILEGGAALFEVSAQVNRQVWRKYVTRLYLDEHYPGIQGVGFIQLIYPQDKAAHLAQIRAEGGLFRHYTLKPDGERALYTSIVYLEPLDRRNQHAIGYDMFSEPTRRATMEQARDTGKAVLSRKVKLIQEIDQDIQAGCLMYVPVYRDGQPHDTVAEKRAALIGYVYSPFRMRDLMKGIFMWNKQSGIDFHIYDGEDIHPHPDRLMYDEMEEDHLQNKKINYSSQFTKIEQLRIAQHTWTIHFATFPNFDVATKAYAGEIVWLGGVVISFLLFGVTRSFEMNRILIAQQQANILLQEEIRERIQIDQALQESQKQLRLITDHIPALIAYVDNHQIYRFVNKYYEECFELPREQIIGKLVKQILGEEVYEGTVKDSITSVLSGRPTTFEMKLLFRDGLQHWIHVQYFPNIDSDGAVIGYFVLAVDISERKRAEETIQEQHAHLLAILENTEDIICSRDQEGQLIFHNTAFTKIVNKLFNIEPYVGLKTLDRLPQEAQTFWKPILAQVVAGKTYRGEFTWTFEGEETRHYEISYYPICKDKMIIGYSEYTRDITDRKQTEEKLQLHKEIVENMSEGVILVYAHDGTIVYTNRTFDRMFGYEVGELLGQPVDIVNAPTDKSPVEIAQSIIQTLNITGIWQGDIQNIKKDGTIFWCHANVSTFKHPQHGTVWVAVHQDITDRKRVEECLQESEEKYRILLENAGFGIGYYDLTGHIILFNQRAAQNMNGQPEDFIGKSVYDIFDEDLAQLSMNRMNMTVASEYPLEFEDRIELPSGIYWFLSILTKIRNSTGEVIGIQVVSQNITDRKHAEERLRESEEKHRILLENAGLGIAYFDLAGHIILFNQRAAQNMNGRPEDFVGKSIHKVFRAEHAQLLTNRIEMTIASEQSLQFEDRIDWSDKVFWFLSTFTRIRNGVDQIVGVQVIFQNITERKCVEEELREACDFAEQVIETANVMAIGLNLSGQIIIYNSAAEAVTGYRYDEVKGQNWFELVVPRYRYPQVWENLSYLTQDHDDIFTFENPILTKGGEERFISWRNSMLHKGGQVIGTFSFGMDITERKKMEELLRANEYLLSHAVRITHLGTFEWNFLEGSHVWSEEFFQIFGIPNTVQPTSELFFHALHPEDRDNVIQSIQFSLTKTCPYEVEYRIVLPNGELRYVQSYGEVQWDNSGQAKCLIGTVLNVTDRKQMELHLQHAKEIADTANQAKSTFLANMSHELRTPLNAILGYAQLLSQELLTEEQKEGMKVIKQSGEYLLTLINDILDLAKVEAGKIELFPSVILLNGFLQEVVLPFQMRAQQKNLFFSYQELSALPTALHADEKRLRQVLINLLGNAVKFTECGGITVKVSYEKGSLYIQIEDTGMGIATTDLEKIFLPFQQADNKKSKQQGTGLGLSITKSLVEMMGGHLQVTSTLGQGSIFWMSLQLPEATDLSFQADYAPLRKIIGYQGPPRTVLVIDDNELNRSILSKMLTPLGFIVFEAANGQTGLDQALENKSIDVIFIDLVMPEMDGFTVIQQLRQIPHHQHTILITLSASAFDSDRQLSIDLGSNDFVPKPINLAFLLERLGTHLQLTWCYDMTTKEMFGSTGGGFPAFELTPSQATELFHLAACGDVVGVSDYVKCLRETDIQLTEFAHYVMKLLQKFDLDEVARLVEPFLGQNPT